MNVYGPKGDLLLSWRVELLPYLEQDNLYKQFKMDEAWDGPNNKKLIEQMPKVYEIVGREAPKGQTFYQAFLTPDPAQPPAKGEKPFNGRSWLVAGGKTRMALQSIPDGTSNTLGVVEAREGVIWSKPDDLPFGEKLPPLGEEKSDVFMVLMLDGSVRAISTKIKPEILRLLIDADGYPSRTTRSTTARAGPAAPTHPREPSGRPTPRAKPPGLGDIRQLEADLQVGGPRPTRPSSWPNSTRSSPRRRRGIQKGLVKKEELNAAEAEVLKAQADARIAEARPGDRGPDRARFLKEVESPPETEPPLEAKLSDLPPRRGRCMGRGDRPAACGSPPSPYWEPLARVPERKGFLHTVRMGCEGRCWPRGGADTRPRAPTASSLERDD